MFRMFLLVFIGLFQNSYGDPPTLCSDGYLEVIKGTETRFTCSNFLGTQAVRWYYNGNTMATCSPLQSQNEQNCVVTYLPVVFNVSRTSPTTSVVTVKPVFKDKQSSLSCEINETKAITNCPVDLTYSATVSSCSVEFSGSTWTVSSQCNITKAYSSQGRYRCDLYQRMQNEAEERRVDSSPMSTSVVPDTDYFSGYCSMTSFLPSDGTYSYRVVLIPGYVSATASFNGNNIIRTPKDLSHNCPTSVPENGSLQCACSVTDRGSPQGDIRWKNSSTNELSLNGVLRAQNGGILTCALTWNRTEIQFLKYTIIVTYPPSDIQFKLNDIETVNATVKESSTVRMVCLADGRPTPSMRLISINKNTVLNTSPRGNVTVNDIKATVTYDIKSVQCEDTGEYECEVDTGPGQTQKRLSLFVMCSPKRKNNDSSLVMYEGNETTVHFEMIANPAPDRLMIYYIGSFLNDTLHKKLELENAAIFACKVNGIYMLTCIVTLYNKTAFDTGFYSAEFSNGLGNVSFDFRITVVQSLTTVPSMVPGLQKSETDIKGPVIGGIIGGVIVIVVVIIIIVIIRRKGTSKGKASVPNEAPKQTFGEEERDTVNSTNELYATVNKQDSKSTQKDSFTNLACDVDIKEGEGLTTTDSKDSLKTGIVAKDKKGKSKISKPTGKGKKNRKGDKELLTSGDKGFQSREGALSMSPITGDTYENVEIDTSKKEKERKGANEVKRRNQQELNYTTVVFASSSNTPSLPASETTEYAEIVPRHTPKD